MESISLADAEGRLSEIIEQAQAGDEVTITRDGKPVAVVRGVRPEPTSRPPIDVDALRALTSKMQPSGPSAVEIVREMRDSRY